MKACLLLLALAASPSFAEPAGPPAPPKIKATPAQVAITNYRREFGEVPLPHPCVRPKDSEVVVCGIGGRGGSPERLPLPDQRGVPDHARTAMAEVPAADASPIRTGSCGTQDQAEHCVGGINPILVAIRVAQIGYAIIDPEGASDLADKLDPPPR